LKKTIIFLIVTAIIFTMAFVGVACKGAATTTAAVETTAAPATTAAAETTVAAETTAATKKYVIGISQDMMDSPYNVANMTSMENTAKELGAELVILVAQTDVNKQIQQIESLITQGVDAIICNPKDGKALTQVIKKANEAGIPFIFNDRAIFSTEDSKVDYGIATDNRELAKMGTQWIVDYAKKNGLVLNALVFIGSLADNNAIERDKGFKEIAEANTDVIKIVSEVPTDWVPEKALSGTVNALQANKDINFIFTPSDYLLPAIQSGLQQAGRYFKIGEKGHIYIGCFDGDAVGMEAIRDGYAIVDMCQNPVNIGKLCVEAAVKIIEGKRSELPGEYYMDPGFLVNVDNFDEMAYQSYGWFGKDKK
jgi:ABC-type sugar transport system substrate-binding protein